MAEKIETGTGTIEAGSVTLPSKIMKAEGLKPGDKVSIVAFEGRIIIQKPNAEIVKRALAEFEV